MPGDCRLRHPVNAGAALSTCLFDRNGPLAVVVVRVKGSAATNKPLSPKPPKGPLAEANSTTQRFWRSPSGFERSPVTGFRRCAGVSTAPWRFLTVPSRFLAVPWCCSVPLPKPAPSRAHGRPKPAHASFRGLPPLCTMEALSSGPAAAACTLLPYHWPYACPCCALSLPIITLAPCIAPTCPLSHCNASRSPHASVLPVCPLWLAGTQAEHLALNCDYGIAPDAACSRWSALWQMVGRVTSAFTNVASPRALGDWTMLQTTQAVGPLLDAQDLQLTVFRGPLAVMCLPSIWRFSALAVVTRLAIFRRSPDGPVCLAVFDCLLTALCLLFFCL